MTSDGFSVKTTISQLGNVARAQTKGQQAGHATGTAPDHKLRSEKRVDKVKKAEETQKQKVEADKRREKKRERGREHEDDEQLETETALNETDLEERDASETDGDARGIVVDIKA